MRYSKNLSEYMYSQIEEYGHEFTDWMADYPPACLIVQLYEDCDAESAFRAGLKAATLTDGGPITYAVYGWSADLYVFAGYAKDVISQLRNEWKQYLKTEAVPTVSELETEAEKAAILQQIENLQSQLARLGT